MAKKIDEYFPQSGRVIKEDDSILNWADRLAGLLIDAGGGDWRARVQVDVDTVTATNVEITNFPSVFPNQHDQPLTDTQLRASDVSVTLNGEAVALDAATLAALTPQTDALTDAELRASAVDVDTGLTQPTTPADTQPVSASSLPLPTGAATAANQLPDNHQVTVSNQIAQPIQDGGAIEVHSEYLFSDYQATLADGAEIDSGWIDMSTVDKYQFEGLASAAGMTQVIESSSGASGAGAAVTTTTPIVGTFQLFNVIARQRYMRFRWQNNTGSAVTNASLAIKASYGSSDKLSVLSLNTTPSDFSQSILTQSVLFGLNEVTTQREQVSLSGNNNLIVALGDRISQTGGRSHHEVNVIGVTTGTLYTVPAGHNFHVTSIEWAGSSTDTTDPVRARIRDGGATGEVKYSLAINEPTAFAEQAGNGGQTYPEPTLFETDVYFDLASGAFTGDIMLVGYLEPI